MNRHDVAVIVDRTILKSEVVRADAIHTVEEGAAVGTSSMCVSPSVLPLDVPEELRVICMVGFPPGAVKLEVKIFEAALAVADGTDEIGMVINIELAKDRRPTGLEGKIVAICRVVPSPRVLKVIIETTALTDDKIIAACRASMATGADFAKMSTGFHPVGGTSTHAVALMYATIGEALGVKVLGSIRDAETTLAVIGAETSHLGMSVTDAILAGLED